MKFLDDMIPITTKHHLVEYSILNLLEKYKSLTFSEIKLLLDENGKTYDEDTLKNTIHNMLVKTRKIVRDEYWSGEIRYCYVDPYLYDSSYTKNYCSFKVDDTKDKKFLLISDTHVGCKELEDFRLLQKVYEKGIDLKANKCFHLGDVFAGKLSEYSDEEIERQLELFVHNYPNPKTEEMMTYAFIGNHDGWVQGSSYHYFKYGTAYGYNFRSLLDYIPSFYMLQRDELGITFQDLNTFFSHRLYISWIHRDMIINHLNEIENEKIWMDSDYKMLISGHLHTGFIYSTKLEELEFDKLLIGVPSTSRQNIGGVVALLVSMHYENELPNNIEITPLICDRNYSLHEGETIEWNFKSENKVYQKTFN